MTDLDHHWLERLQVMGKAQSRYLWILLITMAFYGALQERVYVDTDPLKMPIVDVEISGSFVLGFGPALISFFVLAITGTMRATRTARAKLNLGRGDWSGEELDTSPNALDLAFYTTQQSPKLVATLRTRWRTRSRARSAAPRGRGLGLPGTPGEAERRFEEPGVTMREAASLRPCDRKRSRLLSVPSHRCSFAPASVGDVYPKPIDLLV